MRASSRPAGSTEIARRHGAASADLNRGGRLDGNADRAVKLDGNTPPGADRTAKSHAGGLFALSVASTAMIGLALGLAFFYAPEEATEGFLQRIFYLHVPLAIVCLGGFVAAAAMAIMHLRTRDPRWDLRSYVAIHMSLIFGVAVLISGSIWAKGSWGHWWVWSEPTLVSFLIVFLLYATYQPLRFSIEDPERQARYASVFAVAAGAFVPLNFIAVRLSTAYLHPRVLGSSSNLPGPMAFTFIVSLVSFALLYVTLWRFEVTAKHTRWQVRSLRRRLAGEQPARRRTAEPQLGVPSEAAQAAIPHAAVPDQATVPGPATAPGPSGTAGTPRSAEPALTANIGRQR